MRDIVLSIASMFPSAALPVHAVFVQQRLQALSRRVALEVCVPVPTFPVADQLVPRYAHRDKIPREEMHGDLRARYPRFLSVPKLAKPLDGLGLYHCLRRHVGSLKEHGLRPVLLDAHLAFPEGWAAVRLGAELHLPVSVTLRGHDVNVLANTRGRKLMVQETLRRADRVFGVSRALCDAAIELGAPPERTVVSSNGVDLERFQPGSRSEARAQLGLPAEGPLILGVGHLVERKGFHHMLMAARQLIDGEFPDLRMAIVGAGGEEGDYSEELRILASELGLEERIHWAGAVANERLKDWYVASNLFCLASEKEGWPNVVLEAMACGRPVVASAVWGTPEIICHEGLGKLFPWSDVDALVKSLAASLHQDWDEGVLRSHAEANSWDHTAEGLEAQMSEMLRAVGRELPRP